MKKRIFSLLIALVLCFSFLVGCGEDETESGKRHYDGTHIYTAPETETYLVQDGRTDYRILIPSDFDTHTKFAASELQTFFQQATGIKLVIEYESGEGKTFDENLKYLSIGNTKLLESANFNGDDIADNDYDQSKLTNDGVRILTKGKSVFMLGGNTTGDVNAVYDFLQIVFNYEYYYFNCWEIDEGVLNAKLRNFNVTDIPDFAYRNAAWGVVNNSNDNYKYRGRFSNYTTLLSIGDIENGQTRAGFHNTNEILPPTASTTESEWLSDNGDQWCYTAHGDPDSLERMVNRVVKVIIDCFKESQVGINPNYTFFTITMEDNGAGCGCASCVKAKQTYGADSGAVIVFCNKVLTKLHEEMDKATAENPEEAKLWVRKDMMCAYFAYGYLVETPNVVYDEAQGKYVPENADCVFHPNLGAYAAISNMDYIKDIYHENNADAKLNMEKLFDISNMMVLWTYNGNFSNYFETINNWKFFNTNGYSWMASSNSVYVFNQGNYNSYANTCFQSLKIYLDTKCLWDSSLDTDVLIDNFFNAMFGETADIMKEFWNNARNYDDLMYDKIGQINSKAFLRTTTRAEYWPAYTLVKWMDYCEQAMKLAEETYKDKDPEMYEKVLYHIEQEYVSPCYMMAYLHKKDIVGDKWVDAAKFLKYTAAEKHLTYRSSEGGSDVSEAFKDLQV